MKKIIVVFIGCSMALLHASKQKESEQTMQTLSTHQTKPVSYEVLLPVMHAIKKGDISTLKTYPLDPLTFTLHTLVTKDDLDCLTRIDPLLKDAWMHASLHITLYDIAHYWGKSKVQAYLKTKGFKKSVVSYCAADPATLIRTLHTARHQLSYGARLFLFTHLFQCLHHTHTFNVTSLVRMGKKERSFEHIVLHHLQTDTAMSNPLLQLVGRLKEKQKTPTLSLFKI